MIDMSFYKEGIQWHKKTSKQQLKILLQLALAPPSLLGLLERSRHYFY